MRLLAICRFAWGSLTSRRWRMRELARAAILPAPTLPRPHRQPLAARWRPGVGGYRGPPPCPLTQGDGALLRGRGAERRGGVSGAAAGGGGPGGSAGSGGCREERRLLSSHAQPALEADHQPPGGSCRFCRRFRRKPGTSPLPCRGDSYRYPNSGGWEAAGASVPGPGARWSSRGVELKAPRRGSQPWDAWPKPIQADGCAQSSRRKKSVSQN